MGSAVVLGKLMWRPSDRTRSRPDRPFSTKVPKTVSMHPWMSRIRVPTVRLREGVAVSPRSEWLGRDRRGGAEPGHAAEHPAAIDSGAIEHQMLPSTHSAPLCPGSKRFWKRGAQTASGGVSSDRKVKPGHDVGSRPHECLFVTSTAADGALGLEKSVHLGAGWRSGHLGHHLDRAAGAFRRRRCRSPCNSRDRSGSGCPARA